MTGQLLSKIQGLRARQKWPRGGALLVAAAILALLLSIWWQAGRWYQNQLLKEQRSEAALDVSLRGSALSSAINRRLARLQGLHAFVQSEISALKTPDTSQVSSRFETFAADLYAGSKGIRNLALAPESIVRYVYPLAGNETVLGYDPLNDARPEVRADAQRTIDSREIILTGPVDLIQGGLGLVARQAVFSGEEYWGLVNLVIDMPTVLAEAGLLNDLGDLDLALRDSTGRVFFGSSKVLDADPVVSQVELPDGDWELAGAPMDGWLTTLQPPLGVFQVGGAIIVGLLVGLTYLSVNRQARLAAAVRERTRELQQDIAQRERVEAALREREEQYRGIFDATSDGLVIHDLDGTVVEANPAACIMHGYAKEEFIGLPPAVFIQPQYLELFRASLEHVASGESSTARAVDLKKDGTPLHVEVHGSQFSFAGKPHMLSVVRDVTEQVQAVQLLEQRVAQRTQELTALLELSNQLVTTLEMEPLLELILQQLARAVEYTGATILIMDGDALRPIHHQGPISHELISQVRLPIIEVEALWDLILHHEPLIIGDVRADTALAESYRQTVRAYPAELTDNVRAWMGIPLMVQERLVGAFSIAHDQPDVYTPRHAALALAIANQAAIALENARLYEQARRLAALEERQRLARELHDSVSQALYGIGMGANTARALLDSNPGHAAEALDYVISLTEAGLAEMRALIFELRPDSLEKEGLVAALGKQAAAMRARHGLEVATEFCDEPALPFDMKEALYRIAQEALNNTAKHGRASRVGIRLSDDEEGIALLVQDDGVGFDAQRDYPGHLGLQSMRERAARLRGTLEIESGPGVGTLVRAQIPRGVLES